MTTEEIENRRANLEQIENQRNEIISLIQTADKKVAALSDEVSLLMCIL